MRLHDPAGPPPHPNRRGGLGRRPPASGKQRQLRVGLFARRVEQPKNAWLAAPASRPTPEAAAQFHARRRPPTCGVDAKGLK